MKNTTSPHFSEIPKYLAVASALALAPTVSAQNLSVYVSKPGDTTAQQGLSGTFATEDFNSSPTGDVANGTMSFSGATTAGNGGTYSVVGAGTAENRGPVSIDGESYSGGDTTGGYGGLGEGNYLAVNGTGSTVDIEFATGQSYFGFYWSAGDSSNVITFFDGADNVLGIYSTDSIIQLLGSSSNGGQLTAANGTQYSAGEYYGQDGPGTFNDAEPYGYLHFIDPTSSASIHRVQLSRQTPADGAPDGYFESDNHTVSTIAPDTTGTSLVPIGTVAVPEPGASVLAMLSGICLMFRRRRA